MANAEITFRRAHIFCDCCDRVAPETFDDRDPLTDDIRGHLCGPCMRLVELLDGDIRDTQHFATYLERYREYTTWI